MDRNNAQDKVRLELARSLQAIARSRELLQRPIYWSDQTNLALPNDWFNIARSRVRDWADAGN
jgi:arsenate reductase-like glutaredoxin family protein